MLPVVLSSILDSSASQFCISLLVIFVTFSRYSTQSLVCWFRRHFHWSSSFYTFSLSCSTCKRWNRSTFTRLRVNWASFVMLVLSEFLTASRIFFELSNARQSISASFSTLKNDSSWVMPRSGSLELRISIVWVSTDACRESIPFNMRCSRFKSTH